MKKSDELRKTVDELQAQIENLQQEGKVAEAKKLVPEMNNAVAMFKAAKERNDGSYKSGMVKVLIGSVLLGLGEALGSGSATLFGSDQTSGLNDLGL